MNTSNGYLFIHVLVQILLTLLVYVRLTAAKSRAIQAGTVDLERLALHSDAWPKHVQKINNNLRNQFELPVLFYALVLMLHELDFAGFLPQVLAWVFVASRIVHAYIHTGSNYFPARRAVFTFGFAVLVVMLLVTAWAVVA